MRELQTWMLDAITRPVPCSAVEIERHILPSDTLTSSERLDLYRDMYDVRMREALENDYPALAALLGAHRFSHLVHDYIQRFPSRSYTLNRLGDALPAVLTGVERDLARMELAITEVFDEEESPILDEKELAAVEDFPNLRLNTIRAMRLVAFEYPVDDLFTRYKEGRRMRRPRRHKSWLCIHRRDYSVMRMPLSRDAFECLSALHAGLPVAVALATVDDGDEVFSWFRSWSMAGIFSSIA